MDEKCLLYTDSLEWEEKLKQRQVGKALGRHIVVALKCPRFFTLHFPRKNTSPERIL